MPKKLILDVDTGTDDAVALMLAALHPDLELVAATTVNGNNPIANCTDNTLRVFDLLGLDDPRLRRGRVAARARRLPGPPRDPAPRRGACTGSSCRSRRHIRSSRSQRAVEFLVETYMAATEPIALVPVGPLTNIAMAIKLEPRIVERIPETIIMGGAHASGNTTPAAEFNIWVDPEAARVVFGARAGERDARAARRHAPGPRLARGLRAAARAGHAGGRAAAAFIEGRIAAYDTLQPMDTLRTAPRSTMPCASPTSSTRRSSPAAGHVDVETRGELTIGRTVMDTRGIVGREPNAFVAFDADAAKFVSMLLETFAAPAELSPVHQRPGLAAARDVGQFHAVQSAS